MADPELSPARPISASADGPLAFARDQLLALASRFGLDLAGDPQRCEAMLRDLCPHQRREVFLLVAALKERVAADLISSQALLPEPALIASVGRKLAENLSLNDDAARWAVESWNEATKIMIAVGRPAPEPSFAIPALSYAVENQDTGTLAAVDWAWIWLCTGALFCSLLSIGIVAWSSFFHQWAALEAWLLHTAILVTGLAIGAGGLRWIARKLLSREPPRHRVLDPSRSAGALLIEVVVILALPVVPVLTLGLWASEWTGALHFTGHTHDLAFHLGRILQTLFLLGFWYFWFRAMVAVQGRIASSLVRQR